MGHIIPTPYAVHGLLRRAAEGRFHSLRTGVDDHLFVQPVGKESKHLTVHGAVAKLVGIEGGVVSEVINLESSGVSAPDRRPRHDQHYHEARFLAA